MRILVTGAAGFIGFHVARRLLDEGHLVAGVDNLNGYYDVSLKEDRLTVLEAYEGFSMFRADIASREAVDRIFENFQPERVVHLAAQAGVRYAAQNPHVYVASNVTGTLHVLEGCRHHSVRHLVFASTSSVYGANRKMPFAEKDSTDHPLTLYAATKKANEQMAHSYSHLFSLPCTGLRFFTVYGPWGRPDMALFSFTKAILEGRPIKVFNYGKHKRSFTYIDDVVEGVVRVLHRAPEVDGNWDSMAPEPATSGVAPFRIFNIGHADSIPLMRYISVLQDSLKLKAEIELLPMQPGDVHETHADVSSLVQDVGYAPSVTVEEGVDRFVRWYRDYYQV